MAQFAVHRTPQLTLRVSLSSVGCLAIAPWPLFLQELCHQPFRVKSLSLWEELDKPSLRT